MKNRPSETRWQALLRTTVEHGATGVVALALIVILACVLTGVAASVIWAIAGLGAVMALLILVTGFALRR